MRVSIIGNGFMAGVHAEALASLGHEVAIVIGTNITKLKDFTKRRNIPKYSTYMEDALAPGIDVVHICTPPLLHYAMVKHALDKNKHVICEKPLSLNPDEAKELMKQAERQNLVNGVNFNIRFYNACTTIRQYINSAQFGKINLIHGSYLQEFHALPADYSWRYNTNLAGSMRATSEIGSHWIDLVRYLTGLEITEVSANYGRFNQSRYLKDNIMHAEERVDSKIISVASDDCAIVSLRFSNGAIGNVLLSEVSHGRKNRLSIEISGAYESLWWNTENPYIVNRASKSSGVVMEMDAFSGGFPSTFKKFFAKAYYDISLEPVDRNYNYPTFRDGYINAKVCRSIYESANNNSLWEKIML